MSIVPVPHVPRTGLKHLSYGKNDGLTDGPWMAGFAGFVNMLTGRRLKVLHTSFMAAPTASVFGSSEVGSFQARTSPFHGGVQVMVLMERADSNTTTGYWEFTCNGVAQGRVYAGGAAGTILGPDEFYTQTKSCVDGSGDPIAGNTVIDVTLECSSTARVIGFVVFETWRSQLDTADGGLPLDVYSIGNPILGRDITSITEQLWTLYKQQGSRLVGWSYQNDSAAPPGRTGTTWETILDGSITGYAATAAGHWVWLEKRNTLNSTTTNVTFWCRAQSSAGTTGQVRFLNSGGVIATITGIGALGWYTTTAGVSTAAASELWVVEMNNTDAARTTTVRGYGAYEYAT